MEKSVDMFLDKKILRIIENKRHSPLNGFVKYCISLYNQIYKPTRKRLIAGLTITEKCNLNCTYCYQQYKTNKSITLDKAKELISYILNANSNWTDVEFRLLGGEPFAEPFLIREIIEWTFQQKWNKKCCFKITTNGTLIDTDMKRWLKKNKKRVSLILSLDGPEIIQEKNRSNSFSKIDFDFFRKTWPNRPVKMTISKETINDLFNSIIFVKETLGLNVSFSLAGGQEWNEFDLSVFEKEQEKLISFYSQKRMELPQIYNINFTRILNPNDTTRQCGIGINVLAYDTDGNSYPCHLFLPNVIRKKEIPTFKKFSDDEFLKDTHCNKCVIRNICPTCYAFNLIERGESNCRDYAFCLFYKVIIKNAAKIKMNRFSKQFLLSKNELDEIEAILHLNTIITE